MGVLTVVTEEKMFTLVLEKIRQTYSGFEPGTSRALNKKSHPKNLWV